MNSEENSEAMCGTYSVRELAGMGLSGYPGTERAWLDRVKSEGWVCVEFKGQGRGGIRREYAPPPEVMALIEARQRGEIEEPEKPAKARNKALLQKVPFETGSSIHAEHIIPSAEWIMLSAIAMNDADWLPEMSQKEKVDLGMRLFTLITMLLGADDKKLNLLMDNNVALQAMLRVAYEVSKIDAQVGD